MFQKIRTVNEVKHPGLGKLLLKVSLVPEGK